MAVCVILPSPQVCVKDSTNIEVDSDISLEIPPGTVIAYSVLELEIRKDGQYGEHIDIKLRFLKVFFFSKVQLCFLQRH